MYGISPWAVWFLVAFAAFIFIGMVIGSRSKAK